MKQYKYVHCYELEAYSDWNIVKIIEHKTEDEYDMAVIMKEDISIQKEDNKIEKLIVYDNAINWCCNGRAINDTEKDIIDKLNEIIDYLNSKGE